MNKGWRNQQKKDTHRTWHQLPLCRLSWRSGDFLGSKVESPRTGAKPGFLVIRRGSWQGENTNDEECSGVDFRVNERSLGNMHCCCERWQGDGIHCGVLCSQNGVVYQGLRFISVCGTMRTSCLPNQRNVWNGVPREGNSLISEKRTASFCAGNNFRHLSHSLSHVVTTACSSIDLDRLLDCMASPSSDSMYAQRWKYDQGHVTLVFAFFAWSNSLQAARKKLSGEWGERVNPF